MDSVGVAQTKVADPAWYGPAFLVGFPLAGGALGWGLTFAVEWVVDLPAFPLQGLFELYTRLPETIGPIVAVAVGVVAGVLIALVALSEMLTVTVDRSRLHLERGDYKRTIAAAEVASVFVADKRLVVLGHRRQELARVECDLDRDELAAALREHGYAWLAGGDPYGSEFRLWVPETEGLPTGADALLKARQYALEKPKGEDLEELRDELAKQAVIVRDKDKKQYWRRSDPGPGA